MPDDLCRYCGKPVLWTTTIKGHRMPVDPTPTFGGNLQLTAAKSPPVAKVVKALPYVRRHVSHFATCPERTKRKRRRRETAQLTFPEASTGRFAALDLTQP